MRISNYRVKTEYLWHRDTLGIWIVQEGPPYCVGKPVSTEIEFKSVEEGSLLPDPTFEFNPTIWKLMVDESLKHEDMMAPSDATRAHLRDTITIRDRLLSIVENNQHRRNRTDALHRRR